MILSNHPEINENPRFPDTPSPRFIMGFGMTSETYLHRRLV